MSVTFNLSKRELAKIDFGKTDFGEELLYLVGKVSQQTIHS